MEEFNILNEKKRALEPVIEKLMLISCSEAPLSQIEKDIILQNLRESYMVILALKTEENIEEAVVSPIEKVALSETKEASLEEKISLRETENTTVEENIIMPEESENQQTEEIFQEEEKVLLSEEEIKISEEVKETENEMEDKEFQLSNNTQQTSLFQENTEQSDEIIEDIEIDEYERKLLAEQENEKVRKEEEEAVQEEENSVMGEYEEKIIVEVVDMSKIKQSIFLQEDVIARIDDEEFLDRAPLTVEHEDIAAESKIVTETPIVSPPKRSLNDLFIEKREDRSLNTRFQNEKITDLTKSISINDKFLFIRELFHNKGEEFSRSLQMLNACEDIEGAFAKMEEMKKNYYWDSTSPAYLKLCDLVRRKF